MTDPYNLLLANTMTDSDPYGAALQYLEEHHIVPLFHNLTANIVYHQPDDPVQYIIEWVLSLDYKLLHFTEVFA